MSAPHRYYPVLLSMAGRPCLIVGGGPVAEGKAGGLLAAGAAVRLVSPQATARIERWSAEGRLTWIRRGFQAADLADCFLAISATGDPGVEAAVFREAGTRAVLVNGADDPRHSSFILPAVHRQGEVVIAVSTSGQSPALAVWLRDRIAAFLGPEIGALGAFLGDLRAKVVARVPPRRRRELWRSVLESAIPLLVGDGRMEGARDCAEALIEQASEPAT